MPTELIQCKTIGPFTVCQRKPKPFGATKYVVRRDDDGKLLEDFGRYSTALRWCKAQSPRPVPQVVIDIEAKTAVSTVPLDCTFIDGPHTHTTNATVDPDRIAAFLKSTEAIEKLMTEQV